MPEVSAECVAGLAEVLDLYAESSDPQRPKVTFAETHTQLSAETRSPVPATPGEVERDEAEYKRHGTRTLLLCCAPPAGGRHSAVTEHRTMPEFAHQRQGLVDERYPEAEGIDLGLDNLTTPKLASL